MATEAGKEDTMHKIGEAVTGGQSQSGYLAVGAQLKIKTYRHEANCWCQAYLKQLQSNPLRTKMLTSGTLAALQEVLASWLAHDRSKNGHYFSSRVPKMAAYGALISAPLGHMLISILQRLFANRTSLKAKILQILVSNLIVSHPHPQAKLFTDGHTDSAYPEHRLSCFDGGNCWCSNLAPGQSNCTSWIPASDESQLDHITSCTRIRPEIPSRTDMGSVLQHHCLCYRHIYQHSHQKKRLATLRKKV